MVILIIALSSYVLNVESKSHLKSNAGPAAWRCCRRGTTHSTHSCSEIQFASHRSFERYDPCDVFQSVKCFNLILKAFEQMRFSQVSSLTLLAISIKLGP